MRTIQLAAIGLLLILSGCIKLDNTLTLGNDGSGSVDLNITIPKTSTAQLTAMLDLKKQIESAAGKTSTLTAQEKICKAILQGSQKDMENAFKSYEQYGITVDRVKLQKGDSGRSIYIKLKFADIKEAAKSDIFAMYGFSISKRADNNYVLTRPSDAKKREASALTPLPQNTRMTKKILDGFEVIIRVRTPGMILKTNAQRKSTYSAVWRFDIETDPKALTKLQNQNFGIVFDGREASIPELKYPQTAPAKP